MAHLASALFFALALIAAASVIHVTVRNSWPRILAALRGELGVSRPARSSAPGRRMRPRAAAF